MPRVLPTLSLALGLSAAACLVYAWQLHGRLVEAEAALAAKSSELAGLRARLSGPEHRGSDSVEFGPDGALPPAAGTSGGSPEAGAPPAGRPEGRADAAAAWRNSPEVQHLMALQRRAGLDNRYAALFRKLNLSPADLEKFKGLLVERQSAATDVFNTAREQGLNPRTNREQIRQLVETFEAETDASIRSTLGEAAYQQYQQYEQSLPQRNVVNQFEQRLSYSGVPLYGNQAEQLVSVLAAAAPLRPAPTSGGAPFTGSGATGGRGVTITDAVITQSAGFLSQPQVQALRQLQQEQAAQTELRQQVQQSRRNNNGTTPAPTPPSGSRP